MIQEIEKLRPNPLGEEARQRAEAEQLNIHTASDLIGVESTPISDLPTWLRPEALAKEKAKAAIDAANTATVGKMRAWDQYCAAVAESGLITNQIASGAEMSRRAAATLENQQATFNEWPRLVQEGNGPLVHSALVELFVSERIVALMPGSLEALRVKLATVNKQIAAAEKQYGFSKE